MSGNSWHWFKDYLSNWSHFVSINGHSSDLLPVRSGVPQRSILGPFLFLVYDNNFPCSVSFRKVFLFSDDAKLLKSISHKAAVSHLWRDLDTLTSRCSTWRLCLSSFKCVAMHLNLSASPSSSALYKVNNQPLASVTKHKDLNVMLCANLSWSEHIKLITAKACHSLHFIHRTFSSPAPSLCQHLYLSLVRSQ